MANDIGILMVESELDPDAVSGWEKVPDAPVSSGSTRLSVYWRRAAGGAESAATVTGFGSRAKGTIVTYKNVIATGYPFDVIGSSTKGTETTAMSITGIVPNYDCNDVLYVAARVGIFADDPQYSGQADSNLTGLSEILDA